MYLYVEKSMKLAMISIEMDLINTVQVDFDFEWCIGTHKYHILLKECNGLIFGAFRSNKGRLQLGGAQKVRELN